MKKVCAIIVTYNRKDCLEKMMTSLYSQEYKLNGYILVNNNSNDETCKYLASTFKNYSETCYDQIQQCTLGENIIYIYNSSINMGGAGGFNKGFQIALELEYDYYWVMDDDILPNSDCLKTVIDSIDDLHDVYVPRRLGENFNDIVYTHYRFNNPFVYLFLNRAYGPKKIKKESYDVKVFTFEGPIFSKSIIKRVGLPNEKYFLQGDDYDYALRCLKFTKIKYICNAIIIRQLPFMTNSHRMIWRSYYSARNSALLDIRYCHNPIARFLRPIFLRLRWAHHCKKINNPFELELVIKGINDAKKGIDGKVIEPGPMQGDYDL